MSHSWAVYLAQGLRAALSGFRGRGPSRHWPWAQLMEDTAPPPPALLLWPPESTSRLGDAGVCPCRPLSVQSLACGGRAVGTCRVGQTHSRAPACRSACVQTARPCGLSAVSVGCSESAGSSLGFIVSEVEAGRLTWWPTCPGLSAWYCLYGILHLWGLTGYILNHCSSWSRMEAMGTLSHPEGHPLLGAPAVVATVEVSTPCLVPPLCPLGLPCPCGAQDTHVLLSQGFWPHSKRQPPRLGSPGPPTGLDGLGLPELSGTGTLRATESWERR